MELRNAERKQAKIKLALQGPSGSGKTYSALLLAFGLTSDWNKIAIIDTENHSADLYAHLGSYQVLNLTKPFSPERYIQAIDICEKSNIEVVIIDSITHEWDGAGGIIETHGNMLGNSFTNWSKITPRHNAFVQKILQSPCHIIGTIRTKQDYVLSEKNGKMVPEKVGLKGITRDGIDYEFTIVFDIDIKHHANVSKDRSGLFVDKPEFQINEATGQRIKAWCTEGVSMDSLFVRIGEAKSIKELLQIHNSYPEFNQNLQPYLQKRRMEIESPVASNVVQPQI